MLYTIGFSGHTAEQFFSILKENKVKRVIDIRLYNTSQMAGFAKKEDLKYLLKTMSIYYHHILKLAPSKELFSDYKNKIIDWKQYVKIFNTSLNKIKIENEIGLVDLEDSCLLCAEFYPQQCHRRLVAEYFKNTFGIEVKHL